MPNSIASLVKRPGSEISVLLDRAVRYTKKRGDILKRKLTAETRVLPDFLIIGVPRSGSTSLYYYLINHPNICAALKKEIGYFSNNYNKSIRWYRLHFPSKLFYRYLSKNIRGRIITGEATPNYLYHPLSPSRIKELLPNVKLIVLLRNPVDRLWSGYWQRVRNQGIEISFNDIVENDLQQNQGLYKITGTAFNERLQNKFPMTFLARGIYREKLKLYFDTFAKEQLLILRSEDMLSNPEFVLNNVTDFLELPRWDFSDFRRYNYHNDQPSMNNAIREKLLDFYRPFNQLLYAYLGRDFGWDE